MEELQRKLRKDRKSNMEIKYPDIHFGKEKNGKQIRR